MEANTIYKTLLCPKCGNEFTVEKSTRHKTCSDLCRKSRTPEQLKKLSESRKKYLKENPDKHPWKNKSKYISGPCEHFKNILKSKNIEFVEEYSPLLTNFYSIDIAFPDIKVGIEINGNQHYNKDKTLADYYQERHDKIESEGWMLYEIHYSKVYVSLFIEELLSKINLREQISYDFYIKKDKSEFIGPPKPTKRQLKQQQFFYIKKDKSEFVGPPKPKKTKQPKKIKKEEPNKTQLKYINDLILLDKLKQSNINFYKFGWVNEASKILNISPQAVNKFLKRLDPEFYSTCYVKSSFIGPPKPTSDQIRQSEIYTKLKTLKELNLDFSNRKWTKEASIILCIKSNRVRSWIKEHDLEYFNYIKEKEAN